MFFQLEDIHYVHQSNPRNVEYTSVVLFKNCQELIILLKDDSKEVLSSKLFNIILTFGSPFITLKKVSIDEIHIEEFLKGRDLGNKKKKNRDGDSYVNDVVLLTI